MSVKNVGIGWPFHSFESVAYSPQKKARPFGKKIKDMAFRTIMLGFQCHCKVIHKSAKLKGRRIGAKVST